MSNSPLNLTRTQLAEFLPNQRAIRAFEQLLKQVSDLLPTDIQTILVAINDVSAAAAAADDRATQCLDTLNRIADSLELLTTAPVAQRTLEVTDDLQPPVQIGTLGQQQRDNVDITGGTVAAKLVNNQSVLLRSSATLANGSAGSVATLTNSPVVGNPTKWVSIDDNGTTRQIPTW
jgi:hypothetical protein